MPTTALLKLELGDIRTFEPDFDPALTGFDGAELEALLDVSGVLQVEETAPEIDERLPIVTRSGDLWVLGNHRLICGDARDSAVYARLLSGVRAQMPIWVIEQKARDSTYVLNRIIPR